MAIVPLGLLVILLLVGLVGAIFSTGETRRMAGKAIRGLIVFGAMAAAAYMVLRVSAVPMRIASQEVWISGSQAFTVGPLLFVLVFAALLWAFLAAKKEGIEEEKRNSPSAGIRLGHVVSGAGATLLGLVVIFMLLCVYRAHSRAVATHQPQARAVAKQASAEAWAVEARLRALDEPLLVLDDQAGEVPTAATTLAEEPKKSQPELADEKLEEEPPEEAQKPKTPAKRPAGGQRPDWVGRKPFKDGDVYKMPLLVGLGPSQQLCEEELLPMVAREAIREYLNRKLGDTAAAGIELPHDYVREHMIGDDVWAEPVKVDAFRELDQKLGREIWGQAASTSPEDWVQLYVLVKFDGDSNQRIKEEGLKIIRRQRLQGVGGLMGCLLVALAGVYGCLRFDLATAGAYRGRLLIAALAAILVVIVSVILGS